MSSNQPSLCVGDVLAAINACCATEARERREAVNRSVVEALRSRGIAPGDERPGYAGWPRKPVLASEIRRQLAEARNGADAEEIWAFAVARLANRDSRLLVVSPVEYGGTASRVNDAELRAYAAAWRRGECAANVVEEDVAKAIREFDQRGVADELLALIWREYPAEAREMGLPEPLPLPPPDRSDPTKMPSHSEDFTSVNWYGTRYAFTKGSQAESIRVLWTAWENGGHSLAQETIGSKIGSNATNFELAKVFRRRRASGGYEPHPAWGTMIQQDTKGSYRLVSPT